MRINLNIFVVLLCYCSFGWAADVSLDEIEDQGRYTIEGRVYPPELFPDSESLWQKDTIVNINGGEYLGFLREDGSFIISGVPSGSYVLEIVNADYIYESVSLDMGSFFQSARISLFRFALKLIQKENSGLER